MPNRIFEPKLPRQALTVSSGHFAGKSELFNPKEHNIYNIEFEQREREVTSVE